MSNDKTKTSAPARAQSPEARKKTQKVIGYGAVGLVIGIALVSSALFSKPVEQAPVTPATAAPTATNIKPPDLNAQDVWLGKSASDLKNVSDSAQSLSDNQKLLLDRLDKLEKGGVPPSQLGVTPVPANGLQTEPKPLMNLERKTVQAAPPPPPQAPMNLPPPPAQNQPEEKGAAPQKFGNGMSGISVGSMREGEATPAQKPVNSQAVTQADDASSNDVTNYIPAGSFARVTLLGGMDAPTGGQSQTNPQPVLMRIDNNAILPNKFRFQVKECFVVGSGYGDVSSERAYIRTESLSCVLEGGETIDVAIKGYLAGEDGKTGIRGKLVSKQGQILANALLAGIGSGIGAAFQANSMTNSVSPLGATQTVQPGKQFSSGVSTGVGKAMDRLAAYYISLAEKTFPIVEVDAGRTVDLILTKGVQFKTKKKARGSRLSDIAEEANGLSQRDLSIDSGYYK